MCFEHLLLAFARCDLDISFDTDVWPILNTVELLVIHNCNDRVGLRPEKYLGLTIPKCLESPNSNHELNFAINRKPVQQFQCRCVVRMYKRYANMTNLDVNKDFLDIDSSAIDVENDVKDLVCNVEKLDFKTDFELTDEELHELTSVWEKKQDELKSKCCLEDREPWQLKRSVVTCFSDEDDAAVDETGESLAYVVGTDISFIKGDNVNACAAIVIIRLADLEVVYEDVSMICLTAPYLPGFLAFREASFLVEKISKLQKDRPDLSPLAVLVDGNGILHPKEFGLACHIGVELDIPAVGVAKTLYHVDGLQNDQEHKNKIKTLLLKGGDTFPLVGQSGRTLGVALRSDNVSSNPVYISQGHGISLDTAIWLVQLCCKHRIPEPTRQADIRSRQYLRENSNFDLNGVD